MSSHVEDRPEPTYGSFERIRGLRFPMPDGRGQSAHAAWIGACLNELGILGLIRTALGGDETAFLEYLAGNTAHSRAEILGIHQELLAELHRAQVACGIAALEHLANDPEGGVE